MGPLILVEGPGAHVFTAWAARPLGWNRENVMKKAAVILILCWFVAFPVAVLADVAYRYESGHFACSGTSAVVLTLNSPPPAGATRIKGQVRCLRLFNETPGTTIYCNPNIDSALSAPAVASDATPNQIKLDDLQPERVLWDFNCNKLQCIGAGATLSWEVTEL
jgi:hypothetical protein